MATKKIVVSSEFEKISDDGKITIQPISVVDVIVRIGSDCNDCGFILKHPDIFVYGGDEEVYVKSRGSSSVIVYDK